MFLSYFSCFDTLDKNLNTLTLKPTEINLNMIILTLNNISTFLNIKKNLNNKPSWSKIWEKILISPTKKLEFANLKP